MSAQDSDSRPRLPVCCPLLCVRAGIKVLLKTDAVTMSRNHEDRSVAKRERRGSARAKAHNARAMGQADPAGQQLPASNGVPSSGLSGYPR
jgi:hypothetical protein